jgi:hypothetical protein
MIYYLYVITFCSGMILLYTLGLHQGRSEMVAEDEKAKIDILQILPFFVSFVWGIVLIVTRR